jgi:inosine/xanthosine triphosphate pyrophosphatase family protein
LFFDGDAVLQIEMLGLVSPRTSVDVSRHCSYVAVVVLVKQGRQAFSNVDGHGAGRILKSEIEDR